MNAATLLQTIRSHRGLSQRELAAASGLPRSTIERIEAEQTRHPSLQTVERVLRATGYELRVLDRRTGELIGVDPSEFDYWDRAGRALPAHLEVVPVERPYDGWWGWGRLIWWESDPAKPPHTFHRRGYAGNRPARTLRPRRGTG